MADATAHVKEERPVLRSLLEHRESPVGDVAAFISIEFQRGPVLVITMMPVMKACRLAHAEASIETGRRFVRMAQVPFSRKERVISRLVQQLRQRQFPGQPIAFGNFRFSLIQPIVDADLRGRSPRHHAGARRRTNRTRGKGARRFET